MRVGWGGEELGYPNNLRSRFKGVGRADHPGSKSLVVVVVVVVVVAQLALDLPLPL